MNCLNPRAKTLTVTKYLGFIAEFIWCLKKGEPAAGRCDSRQKRSMLTWIQMRDSWQIHGVTVLVLFTFLLGAFIVVVASSVVVVVVGSSVVISTVRLSSRSSASVNASFTFGPDLVCACWHTFLLLVFFWCSLLLFLAVLVFILSCAALLRRCSGSRGGCCRHWGGCHWLPVAARW